MIKAIIFDCFGVLITDALEATVNDIRATDPERADYIVSVVTAMNKGQIEAQTARDQVAEALGLTFEAYVEMIRNGEVKNTDLLTYIIELRKSYKIGLLSNIGTGGLLARFDQRELDTHFDFIAASSEIGYAKPDPRAYHYVAENLNVEPNECVMIDDRQDYCTGAEEAGMKAILFTSNEQLTAQLFSIEQ